MLPQLAFGVLEVERQHALPGAALLASRRLHLVLHEAIEADAQERAEPRLRRIEPIEELLLERGGEKRLRRVLGVLGRRAPAHAQVLVDRPPVRVDQRLEGLLPHRAVAAANPMQHRQPRLRERPRRGRPCPVTHDA